MLYIPQSHSRGILAGTYRVRAWGCIHDSEQTGKSPGGSVAAIAVVALMVLCPLAVMDVSDADNDSIVTIDYENLKENADANGVYKLNSDIRLSGGNGICDDIVIDGQNKYTIYGMVKLDAGNYQDKTDELTVVLKNLTIDGQSTAGWGIHSQNMGKTSPAYFRTVDLTMQNCTVQNFTNKGVWMTNCQNLTIDGCTFNNVATVDETIAVGDHAIDVCVGGVHNATISITNNTFTGVCGKNAPIQVQLRDPNNRTDDNPDDWGKFEQGTSIENVYIAGNDFSGVDRDVYEPGDKNYGIIPADIRLGSWPKEDDERTVTKAFPATIVAKGSTEVVSCTEMGANNGNNSPDSDIKVTLSDRTEFQVDGTYDKESKKTDIDSSVISGSAVLSGYVPEYMSITVEEGATAVMDGLENHGSAYGYNGNITGTSTRNAVDNTDTIITPPIWDDDDDYVPPIVPSQTGESGDDDTVTIVACAAAAVVAALLAAFLNIDRKH